MITTGTFDGVHSGHRAIIDRMKALATETGGETVLLTFDPHPRHVLQPHASPVPMLCTPEEKQQRLADAGIDHLVIMPFTREFARLSPPDYVRDLLVEKLGVQIMVVGYDHRFGANREGDFELLRHLAEVFSFQVEEIPAKIWDTLQISSTKIRQALSAGDIAVANACLGYEYELSGTVVRGEGRGRLLNFPTANLNVDGFEKLIPARGVYAVRCFLGQKSYDAMLNIGTNPTFGPGKRTTVEAHILHFDGDLYNETIRVRFKTRLRDELKFSSVGALIEQLKKDRQQVESIFS